MRGASRNSPTAPATVGECRCAAVLPPGKSQPLGRNVTPSRTACANGLGRWCVGIRMASGFPSRVRRPACRRSRQRLWRSMESTSCGVREAARERTGRVQHDETRSNQPPTGQEVRRRSLIVHHRGGFPAVTFGQPPVCALRPHAGGAFLAMRCDALQNRDSSPHSMPHRVRVDARAAIPVNVAETANASLDMTAAAVEAAPIGRPARQAARRAPNDEFC